MSRSSFASGLLRGMAFAAAILLAACSSNRLVKRDEPFRLEKSATATLANGQEVRVRAARTSGDSVILSEYHSGREVGVPFSAMHTMTAKGGAEGALKGMGAGFVIGLGAGYLMFNAEKASSPMAGISLFVMPMTGMLYGSIIGALGRTHYLFVDGKGVGDSGTQDTGRRRSEETEQLEDSGEALPVSSASLSTPGFATTPAGLDSLAGWQRRMRDSVKADRSRGRWYFGGDLGANFGAIPSGPDAVAGRRAGDGGLLGEIAVGYTVNPKWIVGARYAAGWMEDTRGVEKRIDQVNGQDVAMDYWKESGIRRYGVDAHHFPRGKGFHLSAGLGYSTYDYLETRTSGPGINDVWEQPVQRFEGGGPYLSAGLGYAFWIGRSFNIRLGAEAARTWYSDGAGGLTLKPSVGLYWF